MVSLEHSKRKGVQPEKPQQGVLGHHGNMDEQVSILAMSEVSICKRSE